MSDEDEETNGSLGIRGGTESSEQEIYETEIAEARERDIARRHDLDRKMYYEVFPVQQLHRMLRVEENFSRREFDFCFNDQRGDGIFWARYKAFQNTIQLRNYLIHAQPVSINVGPSGASPSPLWRAHAGTRRRWGDRTGDAFYSAELVLDIDLKDYDVRTCNCAETAHHLLRCLHCGKRLQSRGMRNYERQCNCEWQRFRNQICGACWNFARSAMVIIDYVLKKKWGIYEFVFVFSGGKGFHCWILDEQVRSFSNRQRTELVASFNPWQTDCSLVTERHRVDPIFGNDFDDLAMLLFEHNVLRTGIFTIEHENTRARIIDFFDMRHSAVDAKLENLWKVCEECVAWNYTSAQVWKALMDYNYAHNSAEVALTIQRRFVYAYVFPRIDEKVSTQVTHARKLPFSPHPTSGCVAIPLLPLTPERIFGFSPEHCPTVADLPEIHAIAQQFDYELANFDSPLAEIRYCEKRFPVIPNLFDLLERNDQKAIFREFHAWCKVKVHAHVLFLDYESYSRHCRTDACPTCDSTIILEPQNILLSLVRRSCWLQGVYKAVLAECIELALLDRCRELGLLQLEQTQADRINNLLNVH